MTAAGRNMAESLQSSSVCALAMLESTTPKLKSVSFPIVMNLNGPSLEHSTQIFTSRQQSSLLRTLATILASCAMKLFGMSYPLFLSDHSSPVSSGSVSFQTSPVEQETEITGHPMARLSISASAKDGSQPSDLDLFLTLRHLDAEGEESESAC